MGAYATGAPCSGDCPSPWLVAIAVAALLAGVPKDGLSAEDQKAPSGPEQSEASEASSDREETEADPGEESPWQIEFGGYGSVNGAWENFGPDPTRQNGARRDSRIVFDDTRLTAEMEAEMPADIELEAEVEFEHGGTGSALEVEYLEFGEFESELEKGGEVLVEELYVEKSFFEDRLSAKVGRFYVAVGLLSEQYRPTDYLGNQRPEAETRILPAVWDEMGASVTGTLGPVELTAQVVNGLDSSGFSSEFWVRGGHQRRFEQIRATNPAGVGRLDVTPTDGVTFGASVYGGNTAGNRPKPDLAKGDCPGDVDRESHRAPCGYIDAPVLIADVHATAEIGPVRTQGTFIWGNLSEADQISEANSGQPQGLNVLGTPVSDQALATWVEAGLDVAPWMGIGNNHRLEPFGRFSYWDTVFNSRDALTNDPRLEAARVSSGLGYTYRDVLVTKLSWSHRWFGSDDFRTQHELRFTQGFTF